MIKTENYHDHETDNDARTITINVITILITVNDDYNHYDGNDQGGDRNNESKGKSK